MCLSSVCLFFVSALECHCFDLFKKENLVFRMVMRGHEGSLILPGQQAAPIIPIISLYFFSCPIKPCICSKCHLFPYILKENLKIIFKVTGDSFVISQI